MRYETFETTYKKYSFAPLVELGLQLGRFIQERRTRTDRHSDANGVNGLAA